MEKRNCPRCNNEIEYKRRSYYLKAVRNNTVCRKCVNSIRTIPNDMGEKISKSNMGKPKFPNGRIFTNEHCENIRQSKIGTVQSEESNKKRSNALKGRIFSDDTIKKMRLSAIKRIESQCGQIHPNYNPDACKIIDEYGKKHNFEFQHAENGGEVNIGGYFPDGIDIQKKTIIEIDENHHFNIDGTYTQRDMKRQKYFENKGYDVIRIKFNGDK